MRHKNLIAVTIYLFLSLNAFSQCINNTNNIYSFTFQSSAYELVKENKAWSLARNCAISRGGGLAIIDSQIEQDTIFYYLNQAGITTSNTIAPDGGGAAYVWLAGNDRSVEGNWVWDVTNSTNIQFWQGARNGNPVNGRYNNWGNEPDDYQGQDALGIALTAWPFGVAGEWNDIDESNSLYYLIEKPLTTGIKAPQLSTELSIYPNPATSQINFEGKLGQNLLRLKVYDLVGKVVIDKNHNLTEPLELDQLNNGIYFIEFVGSGLRKRFIKK